jgi:hypothetical protein
VIRSAGIGFTREDEQIRLGLQWFVDHRMSGREDTRAKEMANFSGG